MVGVGVGHANQPTIYVVFTHGLLYTMCEIGRAGKFSCKIKTGILIPFLSNLQSRIKTIFFQDI